VNQSFGPVNLSNSSLGSYSTSKASASSSGTRGEYRMAPNRKSFHESALNCCETTLHLYSVFRTVLLHIDFFCLARGRFPTALESVGRIQLLQSMAWQVRRRSSLRFLVVIIMETLMDKTLVSKPSQSETAEIRQLLKNEFRSIARD
jgi:hypothetical protein